MRITITGTAGHLGEALSRTLADAGHKVVGVDLNTSPHTTDVGTIVDPDFARRCVADSDVIVHTATLHKPHLVTHSARAFVDTNVTGTLHLLEGSVSAGARAFVFTSTTSVCGTALTPGRGAPAAWITEDVAPAPKNIYGATKPAAEHLCEMFAIRYNLPCIVLRTSRFFAEPDDDRRVRERYDDANAKVNELLFRRVDLADVVSAYLAAIERAPSLGFGRYVISATTPFADSDAAELRVDAERALRRVVPEYVDVYSARQWRMFPTIDRVYVNVRARHQLGWTPRYDFRAAIRAIASGVEYRSSLARTVGAKGYHGVPYANGLYPVDAGS